jgi:hypothetical protein
MAGNIQRRPDEKWRARYRDANHREHARHFPRKRDAEQWLASQEVAIARGGGGGSDPVQDHGGRVATAMAGSSGAAEADDDGALRGRAPSPDPDALGARAPVPDPPLGRFELGAQPDRRGTCSGNRPVRPRVLSLGLTAAVRDGRLVRNVAEGVPLPRVAATPKRFLTHDQVHALAEACAPYHTLIRVLAYAGPALGQARGPDRLPDRPGQAPDRGRRSDHRSPRPGVVGTTKTHQRRSVPIPRYLADELADHLTGKAPGDLVFTLQRAGCCAIRTSGRGSSIRLRRRSDCLTDTARAAPHRSQPCYSCRRQRQSRAAGARARLRRHDHRHLCAPLRR